MGPMFNQPMNNQIMVIPVQGENAVNMYPVAVGTTVFLIDFNAGKFWIKSNESGIPSQPRRFSFTEETQQIQNGSNLVGRDEFNQLAASVATMSQNFDKLVKELGGDNNG